jgi:hypothetical protein
VTLGVMWVWTMEGSSAGGLHSSHGEPMFLMCLTPIRAASRARFLTDLRPVPNRRGTAQRSEAPLQRDRSFVRALVQVGRRDSKVEHDGR